MLALFFLDPLFEVCSTALRFASDPDYHCLKRADLNIYQKCCLFPVQLSATLLGRWHGRVGLDCC